MEKYTYASLKDRLKAEYRIYLLAFLFILIADSIGQIKIPLGSGNFILFPIFYALILGVLSGPQVTKVMKKKEVKSASKLVIVAICPFIAKLGINAGASLETVLSAGPALILQEFGNLGTILLATVVEGEKLDLLIGSRPIEQDETLEEKEKEAVKANVINLLKQYYDMEEEDFLSAELEIVPAGKARDCGLDRSMVLAYGQDDRVCAFTSLFAMLDVEEVEHTACCILVDKEEIGSVGATGMHSRFFENAVAELVALTEGESDLKVRRALMNSRMLSSDVSAAYDPMYAEVFEKRSSAFFGKGLVFNKFTGARGKSGSNDANAEYLAKIRNAMDAQSVAYQFAELGKVDAGGGGTIAYIMANYGMEVIDSGVAVLSMHAPWEVTSKADVYEAYKGYKAFVEEMR